VLPEQTLTTANQSDLTAVLALVGGVTEVRGARGLGELRLRGLSGRHTLLLQDGLRVNQSLMPDLPIQLVDVSQVERVTILLGPEAAGHGSGALGGVVSLSSSIRTLRDSGFRGTVRTRFASAELERGASAGLEGSTGSASLRLGLSGLGTSPLRAGGGIDANSAGYDQFGGRLAFRIDHDRWVFEGLGGYATQVDLDSIGQEPTLTERSRSFNWIGFTTYPTHPAIDLAQLRLGLQRVSETLEVGAETNDVTGTMSQLASSLETHFGDVQLGWDLDFVHETLQTDSSDLALPDLSSFRDGASVVTPGVGVRATIPMGESEFALATRVDWRSADVPTDAGALTSSEFAPSASVSLSQRLLDGLDGFVQAGTAVSLPHLSQLFVLERRDTGTFLPNSELAAERSAGADLGIDWRFEPLSIRVVAGYAYLFDWIVVAETGELDPDNLDALGRPLPNLKAANQASAHSVAVETEVGLGLGDMLLVAHNQWMWSENVTSGSPLASLPPLSGRVSLSYRGFDWSAGPYFRYAAAQTRGAAENQSTGHAVLGIRADARFGWARVFVTLDNLSDARYRLHGSSLDEPGFNASISIAADWY